MDYLCHPLVLIQSTQQYKVLPKRLSGYLLLAPVGACVSRNPILEQYALQNQRRVVVLKEMLYHYHS